MVPSSPKKFPYHYGSYATGPGEAYIHRGLLSFPYHYGSYATRGFDAAFHVPGNSFHTTMVLTQPLLLQRYYTGFG